MRSSSIETKSRRGLLIVFIVMSVFLAGVLINTELVMSSQLSTDIHTIMLEEVKQTKIMETFINERIKQGIENQSK